MKSILFIAFLAIAAVGCDTPEKSTGSDTTTTGDTMTTQPMPADTTASMPVDTTTTMPSNPTDTSTTK